MFEFFFKYPAAVFSKGTLVLLGPPAWSLISLALVLAAVLGLPFMMRRRRVMPEIRGIRAGVLWLLESSLAALILLLLWQPAVSVAELKPQQNLVAVMVDDSRSMALREDRSTRTEAAIAVLKSGLIKGLQDKFQVRLYRFGDTLERIQKPEQLNGTEQATHIGSMLKAVLSDSAILPLGAIVLLSDGSDNSGGVNEDTIAEILRQHIPVHTIGFGREQLQRDVELSAVQLPERIMPDSLVQARVTIRQQGYDGQRAHVVMSVGDRQIASRDIVLKGSTQTETMLFGAGEAGVKNVEFAIQPLDGEHNRENNRVTRAIHVDSSARRI